MDLNVFLAFNNAELICPIGIGFGTRGNCADAFLIEVIGDEDSPVRSERKMIGFCDEQTCRHALERIELSLSGRVKVVHDFVFACDIAGAMDVLTSFDYDKDAVVLNCVNTLLDLVMTGPSVLPPENLILLTSLADHLTFKEDFGQFKTQRSIIRNALTWCAGSTILDLRFIRSTEEFDCILPTLSAEPRGLVRPKMERGRYST